jgi:hypothetical protein
MEFSLGTILASTVVAAIVSGVISLVQSERSQSAQHITKDRAAWRSEIKSAMQKLKISYRGGNELGSKVREALATIECQLNPYGKYQERVTFDKGRHKMKNSEINYFLTDGHIWETICQFEENPSKEGIRVLLEYLSLSLKYDWERSKAEVRINYAWAGAIITALVGFTYYAWILPDMMHLNVIVFAAPVIYLPIALNVKINGDWDIGGIIGIAVLAVGVFLPLTYFPFEKVKFQDYIALICSTASAMLSAWAMLKGPWWRKMKYLQALENVGSDLE